MELSAELLSRITGVSGATVEPWRKERRSAGRIAMSARVTLRRVLPGATRAMEHAVHVREVSRRGAGFLHNAPLTWSDAVTLQFPLAGGGSVIIAGKVTRCRRAGSIYSIGIHFTELLLERRGQVSREDAYSRSRLVQS